MSWDGRCTVKQYPMFVPGAGSLDNPVIVTPANARRTLLEIQVTSANPAFFRWDSLTSNVDDIFFIPANGFRRFNAPCPTNRLISWAQADINLAVLEGLRP